MRPSIILTVIFWGTVLGVSGPYTLEECAPKNCKLPNCQCSSTESPAGSNSPQLVLLSFDDAAAQLIFDDLWAKLLFEGTNPDGCPISGTFFVPHEFSNYQVVNELYNKGFEIASHSITKKPYVDYWREANRSLLIQEMGGQREILSKFANVPKEEILGARIPYLQINHDTFQALQDAGFQYDASWPTQQFLPFFPYTLDFASKQICAVTWQCFLEPVKGFWEIPIIDLINQSGTACNSLLGCSTNGTADALFVWLKDNFEAISKNQQSSGKPASRAPFNLILDYAWYASSEDHKESFKRFLKYLIDQPNTYIVSHKQALEWAKSPSPEFNSCQKRQPKGCEQRSCYWKLAETERYMVLCGKCPKNYPWLGNPLGE